MWSPRVHRSLMSLVVTFTLFLSDACFICSSKESDKGSTYQIITHTDQLFEVFLWLKLEPQSIFTLLDFSPPQDNYTFAQPGIQRKVKALEELVSRIDGKSYALPPFIYPFIHPWSTCCSQLCHFNLIFAYFFCCFFIFLVNQTLKTNVPNMMHKITISSQLISMQFLFGN